MNLLILPGNSSQNEEWAEQVANSLHDQFEKISLQKYEHWKTGENTINFEVELSKLKAQIEGIENRYVVFAKSAGYILACLGIQAGLLRPKAVCFVGLPVHFARKLGYNFKDLLKDVKSPSLIIQHTNDPAASVELIKNELGELLTSTVSLQELAGEFKDQHHYPELSEIKNILSKFLQASV